MADIGEQGAMEIEYELTLDDLVAFNKYHYKHSRAYRRQWLRGWLLPAAIILLPWLALAGSTWSAGRSAMALWPLAIGAPLYLALYPLLVRRQFGRLVPAFLKEGDNNTLLGKHRLAIGPNGLRTVNEHHESTVRWSGVERIAQDDDYLFVYVSAMSAYIVPRCAFSSDWSISRHSRRRLCTTEKLHWPQPELRPTRSEGAERVTATAASGRRGAKGACAAGRTGPFACQRFALALG
jgi:hypothetical protein